MQKNLVIVESPAKAKTIEKFLGKDFKVLSSYGHIRDLKKKEFSIDVDKNFKPDYEIPADKKALVSTLKAEAKEAETVWLASDEDREGEAIAWHLYEVLKLKPENTKRIVFHEITKGAILKAIEQPRNIDLNLVNAQQARRILDRIVGFELSPVLWRKVKPSLSAGRVQSVAVRLIVEREREIHAFKSEAAYRVIAIFLVPDTDGKLVEMKAELSRRIKTKEEAKAYFLKKAVRMDVSQERFDAVLQRLEVRQLVVSAQAEKGDIALYRLLAKLYVIPLESSFMVKVQAFFRFIFFEKLPLTVAKNVFQKENYTGMERRVLHLGRKARLSCAEILACIANDESDTAVWNPSVLQNADVCDNLGFVLCLCDGHRKALEAISTLYLNKNVIFDKRK